MCREREREREREKTKLYKKQENCINNNKNEPTAYKEEEKVLFIFSFYNHH